jgi:hypothetical protein
VRRLLDLAGPGVEPLAEAKNRVSTRLASSLLHAPLGRVSASSSDERPPNAMDAGRSPFAHARLRWLAPVGLAFVMGGAVGGRVAIALRQGPPDRVVYVERAAEVAAKGHAVPESTPETPASIEGQAPSSASAESRRMPVGSSARAKGLAAEQAMLDVARRALATGRPEQALARLGAHRRAFPQSVFAEERDALTVNALVQTGRPEEARALAAEFAQRFPNSMLLPSVQAAIEAIP